MTLDFDTFIAPMTPERFCSEFYGREPVHISAEPSSERATMMQWDDIPDLVGILSQWRDGGLKMVLNRQQVTPQHYLAIRETATGRQEQPDVDLVRSLMDIGASLILDGVEDVRLDMRRICAMLGREFGAKAGLNLYASKRGIQAFASHCDPHEVFVVQCEGEKEWRIYGNRAENPVSSRSLRDQAAIDAAKGPIAHSIIMRPGDLLYIPRGFYHDATARTERSLHLTFAVQPLYGVILLDLLRDMALDDPAFRAYLPPAEKDKEGLARMLASLSDRIGELLGSQGAMEDIVVRQRSLSAAIEERAGDGSGSSWQRTERTAAIYQPPTGSYLATGNSRFDLGYVSDAASWMLGASVFSEMQLFARFQHHPVNELRNLLEWFARQQLVRKIGEL